MLSYLLWAGAMHFHFLVWVWREVYVIDCVRMHVVTAFFDEQIFVYNLKQDGPPKQQQHQQQQQQQ